MRNFKIVIVIIVGYVFLISIATYPLCRLIVHNDFHTVIGNFHNPDFPGTLWLNWWLNYSIKNHLNFFHTDYLSYPFGENLWCSVGNFLTLFLFYPINKILGLIRGFNFTAFVILLLNCLAGFTLINAIVKDKYLAFLGGFIIGVNLYSLRELAWGRLDQLVIFWFIFFLWALVKIKDTKAFKFVYISALFFILTTLGSFHYGIISLILVFFWLILAFFKKEYYFLKYSFFSLIIGILVLSPVLIIFLYEFNSEYHFPLTNVDLFHDYFPFLQMMTDHSLDPVASFSFFPYLRSKFDLIKVSPFIFALSFIFLLKNWRKRKNNIYWNTSWIISIILSLGPLLQFNHHPIRIGFNRVIPLPFYFLAKYVPFFSRFFWPYRFLVVFYISSVVIILISFKEWFRKKNKVRKISFIIGSISVIILELAFYFCYIFPFPRTKIKIPGIYFKLKSLPEGGVLELPYFKGKQGTEYLYYQTIYKKKLVNSSCILSPELLVPPKYRKFLSEFDLSPEGIFIKNKGHIEMLKKIGVRYVVFDESRIRNMYNDSQKVKILRKKIIDLFGHPFAKSDKKEIYLFILN